jgi:hypothetical protein
MSCERCEHHDDNEIRAPLTWLDVRDILNREELEGELAEYDRNNRRGIIIEVWYNNFEELKIQPFIRVTFTQLTKLIALIKGEMTGHVRLEDRHFAGEIWCLYRNHL